MVQRATAPQGERTLPNACRKPSDGEKRPPEPESTRGDLKGEHELSRVPRIIIIGCRNIYNRTLEALSCVAFGSGMRSQHPSRADNRECRHYQTFAAQILGRITSRQGKRPCFCPSATGMSIAWETERRQRSPETRPRFRGFLFSGRRWLWRTCGRMTS